MINPTFSKIVETKFDGRQAEFRVGLYHEDRVWLTRAEMRAKLQSGLFPWAREKRELRSGIEAFGAAGKAAGAVVSRQVNGTQKWAECAVGLAAGMIFSLAIGSFF